MAPTIDNDWQLLVVLVVLLALLVLLVLLAISCGRPRKLPFPTLSYLFLGLSRTFSYFLLLPLRLSTLLPHDTSFFKRFPT
jgi:hypothetical protein